MTKNPTSAFAQRSLHRTMLAALFVVVFAWVAYLLSAAFQSCPHESNAPFAAQAEPARIALHTADVGREGIPCCEQLHEAPAPDGSGSFVPSSPRKTVGAAVKTAPVPTFAPPLRVARHTTRPNTAGTVAYLLTQRLRI